MRLIRLAAKQIRKAAKNRGEAPDPEFENCVSAVLESITAAMAGNMADAERAHQRAIRSRAPTARHLAT
jgi:hypothetical protein